jgi:hypothetical protein
MACHLYKNLCSLLDQAIDYSLPSWERLSAYALLRQLGMDSKPAESVFHADDPITSKDLILLYLLIYGILLLLGSGKYSIDNMPSKHHTAPATSSL